jgi:flagellar FliL protein
VAEEEKPAEGAAEEGDAVQKKGGGDAPAAAGPNQKLIFLVLILNVVIVIAVAVLVWMGNAKRTSTVSLADIAADKSRSTPSDSHGGGGGGDGHGGGAPAGKAEGPTTHYIAEQFTVNITGPQGSKYAKVDVAIEVDDDFVKAEIEKLRPRIRDFILVVLSSKTPEQIESLDGRDFLREEIRNKVNGYLSRGKIKNVYFTQFIVQ